MHSTLTPCFIVIVLWNLFSLSFCSPSPQSNVVAIPAITYDTLIGDWEQRSDCSSLSNGANDVLYFVIGSYCKIEINLQQQIYPQLYRMSLTGLGDAWHYIPYFHISITLHDTNPPEVYETTFYGGSHFGTTGQFFKSWREIVLDSDSDPNPFNFLSGSSNYTLTIEGTDFDDVFGFWIDSFYLIPESFPGSGLFVNHIAQVDSPACPLNHLYPFARIGAGMIDYFNQYDFDKNQIACETPSNGAFSVFRSSDFSEDNTEVLNIYGVYELIPGNYTVSIMTKVDPKAHATVLGQMIVDFNFTVSLFDDNGVSFAEFKFNTATFVLGSDWSELHLGVLEVSQIYKTWSAQVIGDTIDAYGFEYRMVWFENIYVTPIEVLNNINIGNNLICNRNLDPTLGPKYDLITEQYVIPLYRGKLANTAFFIFEKDCSSLSNGSSIIPILWSYRLPYYKNEISIQLVLEPNVYIVSITYKTDLFPSPAMAPFTLVDFSFDDSMGVSFASISWNATETTIWTEDIIGTITVSQPVDNWTLVYQHYELYGRIQSRFYLDSLYIYPATQQHHVIPRASTCPSVEPSSFFDAITFSINEMTTINPINLTVRTPYTPATVIDVSLQASFRGSKRSNNVFSGNCRIFALNCTTKFLAFSIPPGTYDVTFNLTTTFISRTYSHQLVITPGKPNLQMNVSSLYTYNSIGSVQISIDTIAIGGKVILHWLNKQYTVSDWESVGNRSFATVTDIVTSINFETAVVTFEYEPWLISETVMMNTFTQKAIPSLQAQKGKDDSIVFFISPLDATGIITLTSSNGKDIFSCTIENGTCVLRTGLLAGLYYYFLTYSGDTYYELISPELPNLINNKPLVLKNAATYSAHPLFIGDVVTFTVVFQEFDLNDTHVFYVDFGDNSPLFTMQVGTNDSFATTNHTYSKAGKYVASARIADDFYIVNSDPFDIDVRKPLTTKGNSALAIALSVAGGVFVIIAGVLLFLYYRRRRLFINFRMISSSMEKVQKSAIDASEIAIHEKLGFGGHSDVYRATFRGTDVAVKVMNAQYFNSESSLDRFEFEVAIMCGLRHPNIILFMGSYIINRHVSEMPTKSFSISVLSESASSLQLASSSSSSSVKNRTPENSHACIVMEYMSQGSLSDIFVRERIVANCLNSNDVKDELTLRFPDVLLFHIAFGAAKGLDFLHQSKPCVIHRDIKTANILVDDNWTVKLSDFGITSMLQEELSGSGHQSLIGTISFIAPELLYGNEVSVKTDIYSFGFVLWEMFHYGADPFYEYSDGLSAALALQTGLRPSIDRRVVAPIANLIQDCWAQNPKDRPNSMAEVCRVLKELVNSHPFTSLNLPGLEIGSAPKSGELYYVFTDIEESSSLWESIPAAMTDALKLHNVILRHNAHQWRGYEVRFEGDSYFMVFTNVTDCIMFCVYCQKDLLEAAWPIDLYNHESTTIQRNEDGEVLFRGLRVRMGINKGESRAELNPVFHRMDYFGTEVNKAARMLSLTRGGQIYTSSAVAQEYEKIKKTEKEIEEVKAPKSMLIMSKSHSNLSPRTPKYSYVTTRPVGEYKLKGFKALEMVHEVVPLIYAQRNFPPPITPTSVNTPSNSSNNNTPLSVVIPDSSISDSNSDTWSDVMEEHLPIHIPFGDIQFNQLLSTSPSGAFHKATWHNRTVTAKVPATETTTIITESEMLNFKAEVIMLSKLAHPNIVHYYGGCLDRANFCLVMEYMENGSMLELITRKQNLSFVTKLQLLLDVAKGIEYIHGRGVIHRDIKPANLFIADNHLNVKISNFSVCKLKEAARTTVYKGEVRWTAPELLLSQRYDEKVDIYSFGMVMYALYCMKAPYDSMDVMAAANDIISGKTPEIPKECTREYSELMQQCWSRPKKRPSASYLCELLNAMIWQEKQTV